jgi:hypothetical protein
MISVDFYWIFLSLCSAYVFIKGGPPERVAVLITIVASGLTLAVSTRSPALYQTLQIGVFAVDVLTLGAFAALALIADRFWPLWITGIHMIGVATHAAKLVRPEVVPWVYGMTQALWSYPILLLIVIGAARHQSRLRLYGADNSWSSCFGAAARTKQRTGPTG